MLLDLPTELIRTILGFTSSSAYIQAATCCKCLYAIASESRDLVLAHLQRTPGAKRDTKSRSTQELFTLLQRRVANLLLNASFYADQTTYTFNGKKHDVGASSIGRIGMSAVLALVFKGDARVDLVYVDPDGAVCFKRSIDCSPLAPEECPGTIVKTTFANNDSLAVLVRGHTIKDKKVTDHVFAEQMRKHGADAFYYYFFYIPLIWNSAPKVCRIYGRANFRPQALACTKSPTMRFAISWQDRFDDRAHEVSFYCTFTDHYSNEVVDERVNLCYLKYKEYIAVDENGHRPSEPQNRASWSTFEREPLWTFGPVKGIRLSDCQAFYSYEGSALFDYSQVVSPGFPVPPYIEVLSRPVENLSVVQTFDIPFSVSTPFIERHDREEDRCNHQYLCFGTATHPSEHWVVACLLKNRDELQYTTCGFDSEPEWETLLKDSFVPVARLWGYQKPVRSTIGCSPAISPQCTRIAVADWNTIYVWALDPMELAARDWRSNSYYPRAWRSSSLSDGLVELRPVVFRLEAVCFDIIFTGNEDIIMALTDKGLITLDLRPQAQGRRHNLQLPIPFGC